MITATTFARGFVLAALPVVTLAAWLHWHRPAVVPAAPVTAVPAAAPAPEPEGRVEDRVARALSTAAAAAPGKDPPAAQKVEAAAILARLPAEDVPAAVAALNDGSLPGREWMLRALMIRWAELDGPAAFAFAGELKYDMPYKSWEPVRDMALVWGTRAPAEFADWAPARKKSGDPALQHVDLPTAVARGDVLIAARLLCEERGSTSRRQSPLRAGIRTVEDLRRLRGLMEEHPYSPARTTVQNGVTRRSFGGEPARDIQEEIEKRWPVLDPAGWAEHIKNHPLSAMGDDLKILNDAPRLSTLPDPAAAADTLLREADKVPRPVALARIVEEWGKQDINAAGAWLSRQPFGVDTVPAIQVFAKTALALDPAAAFTWLDAIPDPAFRESSAAWLYEGWHRRDPSAASAWLSTAGWSPARQRFVNELIATRPLPERSSL